MKEDVELAEQCMGTFNCKLLRQFACKLQNMYQVIARGGKQATAFNTSNIRTH